jgi:hypothetical protein
MQLTTRRAYDNRAPTCRYARQRKAMSADRGDVYIRVIWVLPGGGQQCTSVARAQLVDCARAYVQMGMLARRVGRQSLARCGGGIAAGPRVA